MSYRRRKVSIGFFRAKQITIDFFPAVEMTLLFVSFFRVFNGDFTERRGAFGRDFAIGPNAK